MSKGKSLSNGNGSAESTAASAGTFMAALSMLAQPFAKPDLPADPMARMRAKFATNVDAAIGDIQAGADKGKWFRRLPSGGFVVNFRNANTALPLNCATHFQVPDPASAVGLLEAAKAGVEAGELDEALKATQRQPPVRKAKQPQVAEPS